MSAGERLLFPDLEPEDVSLGWLVDAPSVTSSQVLDALSRRHSMAGWNGRPGRWVFLREVCAETGSWGEQQRFDALAVGLVPSVKYARVVYEVKVSRGDWLRELKPKYDVRDLFVDEAAEGEEHNGHWETTKVLKPGNKWDAALAVSTEFWYAAPPRCILPSELPPEAGLLEVRGWGPNHELRARVVRQAAVRETPVPGASFWSAVLREAAKRESSA